MPVRMILGMRQLTSLDQQFLALEDGRTHGHVSALGIDDPRTAAGHPLDVALVRKLVEDRLHLLATFRWRLVQVPLGLDYDYWLPASLLERANHFIPPALFTRAAKATVRVMSLTDTVASGTEARR